MNIKLFIVFALGIFATIFIVQNTEVVEMQILFWKLAMSRVLMFVSLIVIGVVIGWLIRGHMIHKEATK